MGNDFVSLVVEFTQILYTNSHEHDEGQINQADNAYKHDKA